MIRAKTSAEGKTVLVRQARYGSTEFAKEMDTTSGLVDQLGPTATRAEIEAIAKSIRPADPFLTGPDMISRPPVGIDR